jgi:RNase adaptor protein for sRNA GlmZ degradation
MTTVARLHKLLGELVANGHGRKPVVINKRTFKHPLEDEGCVMIDVRSIEGPRWICTLDDDGGSKINADGSEAGKRVVVLIGDWPEETP